MKRFVRWVFGVFGDLKAWLKKRRQEKLEKQKINLTVVGDGNKIIIKIDNGKG